MRYLNIEMSSRQLEKRKVSQPRDTDLRVWNKHLIILSQSTLNLKVRQENCDDTILELSYLFDNGLWVAIFLAERKEFTWSFYCLKCFTGLRANIKSKLELSTVVSFTFQPCSKHKLLLEYPVHYNSVEVKHYYFFFFYFVQK